jgi:hypothetical protein
MTKPAPHNCYPECRWIYDPVKPCGYFNTDYYPSGAIRHFCRGEMMFLLANLEYLEEGRYPKPQSGYVDTEKTFTPIYVAGAYFETPLMLAGEVRVRLNRTKEDGITLLSEAVAGLEYRDLAITARRALNYICGINRRHQSYREWKKQRNYQKGAQLYNNLTPNGIHYAQKKVSENH